MKPEGLTGVRRLVAAYQNSQAGLRDMWQREAAFRQEVILLAASVPMAIWLGQSIGQTALLIGSILVLVIVEILNSAIEAAIDRIGPERHELSRIAKDLGSAAVLLTALIPFTTWSLVLADRLGWITL